MIHQVMHALQVKICIPNEACSCIEQFSGSTFKFYILYIYMWCGSTVKNWHSFIFRPICSANRCIDRAHGVCLFHRDPEILKNCLYKTVSDVRLCSSPECRAFSVNQRKSYRVHVRAVYYRSAQSPCFKRLQCVIDSSLRRGGPNAPRRARVST